MIASAFWWMLLNLISIVVLAFYSMMEMACVSFNKVRLHYYVHQGNSRAKMLNFLLHHPFRLFGTTLIGVNVAMVIGSECSREFHAALGLSPDLAPLTQVVLVVIFGELAPMFAARNYAEHVAMLGIPIVYATARLLSPILQLIGWISKIANYLLKGKTEEANLFLNLEELQKILEEHGEDAVSHENQEINLITQNIFRLRHLIASDVMIPLHVIPRLPSNAYVGQMKKLVKQTNADFILIYYKEYKHIVSVAFPRDYLRFPNSRRVRDYARQPWFVTENTPLTTILQQFQRNNQSVAIILDRHGQAKGLITLNDLLSEIFGEASLQKQRDKSPVLIERTFLGETTVKEFNQQFSVTINANSDLTLSELVQNAQGYLPEVGETIYIEPFEMTIKETSLLEVKSLVVKTRVH
ncbi:Conserved membrane protein [Waddlia chondrophila 2032/99]|uniref:Conserved membrane protein n=2 Tax=Waddlia chondrophila TaxID=71667 RepID=D6YVZ9_WADCW|nr:hemolysin family protein [Waddlia chondrophila]ADI38310.1 conserved membrane protein [Waddlia chondrophila WSU 86-1044]CCB91391.1 Conserved membrane protein [Waddlia chondrophila 2032/99]